MLAAPLASAEPGRGRSITISGARSLSDQVSVRLRHGQAGADDRRPPAGLQRPARQPRGGREQHLRQVRGWRRLPGQGGEGQAGAYGDNQATVFAGDNIGASPLQNGLFFEEPIVIAINLMNVDFASVGNHEFDKGSAELKRIQNGGCHAVVPPATTGCTAAPYALADGGTTDVYPGADFQYLSANVVVDATGSTLFPAYATKRFKSDSGKKFSVGFIGEVLESTPTIVTPTGVAGLTFQDEADAANELVRSHKHRGVDTFVDTWVLVIHEGGFQSGTAALNGCAGNLAGSAIADIASRLDPSIKVIVSAHTHAEYRCTITSGGVTRLITSAASFGRILTDITLTIDDKSGELVEASAANSIVENALNPRVYATTIRQPDTSKEDPQVAGGRQPVRHAGGPAGQPDHRQDPGRPDPHRRRRSASPRSATSSPTPSTSPRSPPRSAAPSWRS